jgi:hypothetical protein
MRKCRILVEYYDGSGRCPARFWDYADAVQFAALKARRYSVELFAPSGIVGQWHNGKVTAEFSGRGLPDAPGV